MHLSLEHDPAARTVDTSASLGWSHGRQSAQVTTADFAGFHGFEARYRRCCNAVLICTNPAPRFWHDNPARPAGGLLATIFDAVVAVFCWGFVVRKVADPQSGLARGGTLVLALSRKPRARISKRP